jgi:hypothetical protein
MYVNGKKKNSEAPHFWAVFNTEKNGVQALTLLEHIDLYRKKTNGTQAFLK